MKELGEQLQRERVARGVTLDSVKEKTKIVERYLIALENGDFHQLPGDPYAKGFIRSYAKAIGCDPEPFVAMYMERCQPELTAALNRSPEPPKGRALIARVNQTLQWLGL